MEDNNENNTAEVAPEATDPAPEATDETEETAE